MTKYTLKFIGLSLLLIVVIIASYYITKVIMTDSILPSVIVYLFVLSTSVNIINKLKND